MKPLALLELVPWAPLYHSSTVLAKMVPLPCPWLGAGGRFVLPLSMRTSPSPGGKAGKSGTTVAASLILYLLDLSTGSLWQSFSFPNLVLAPLPFSVWLFCSGKLCPCTCSCWCPQWGNRVSHLPIPWESGQSACIFLVCTASSLLC